MVDWASTGEVNAMHQSGANAWLLFAQTDLPTPLSQHHVRAHSSKTNHYKSIGTSFQNSLLDPLRSVHHLVDGGSQPCHGCGHSFALTKNRRSGYQNVRSLGSRQRSSFCIDTPVHLYIAP